MAERGIMNSHIWRKHKFRNRLRTFFIYICSKLRFSTHVKYNEWATKKKWSKTTQHRKAPFISHLFEHSCSLSLVQFKHWSVPEIQHRQTKSISIMKSCGKRCHIDCVWCTIYVYKFYILELSSVFGSSRLNSIFICYACMNSIGSTTKN